ncbi:aspartyl protease family protein [Cognatilysobacter bugurensis]|uniref:Aspartyl protease n=1 Tax=Cognatilysobacter bugurensis TaxID=543356 RepID=A0A918T4F7_9GAMM|nr:aspartyl protease family protein [Lysobacter bugurensis]GHA83149.1 hypothetical protein GCM10007067_21580 [Lysobacter bugurensis]
MPAPAGNPRARADRRLHRSRQAAAIACALVLTGVLGRAHADTPPDACAARGIPPAERLVQAPFETVDGRIYVQARVNGQGPFRFAVDTGASGMGRADASLASQLGLVASGQARTSDGVQTAEVVTTRIASIELGGLMHRDLDVITRDYNARNAPEAAFAGIIARDFFADGLLVIDYPNKTLMFTRTQDIPANATGALAYERAFRIPVQIGNVQAIGQLDTGANVHFVLPRSLYDQLPAGELHDAGRGRLTNGDIETQGTRVHGPFRIGDVSLSDVDVRVSERFPELLVGARALQDAVVLIDQRSKRVAVCR